MTEREGARLLTGGSADADAGSIPAPSVEAKGDGETWETYAHRLEARIKEQRDCIKNLVELRKPGDIKARKRIAYLERLLGVKEVALAKQHEGISALKAQIAVLSPGQATPEPSE